VTVVVVGASESGKTALVDRYTQDLWRGDDGYTPTLFQATAVDRNDFKAEEEAEVQLVLQDTAGRAEHANLRPPCYLHADVAVVTFDLLQPHALDNVRDIWLPEVRRYCGNIPVLLAATKADLALQPSGSPPVFLPIILPQTATNGSGASCEGYHQSQDVKSRGKAFSSLATRQNVTACLDKLLDGQRRCMSLLRQASANDAAEIYEGQTLSTCAVRTVARGRSMTRKLGANGFHVTSAVLNVGIDGLIDAAFKEAMASKKWRKKFKQ